MHIRHYAYLLHVNAIITVLVACCYGWRSHVISAWNRCHDDSHVVLYNRRLDACLWECAVRESCVAVQYQRMKRSCGIVTSHELEAPLETCVGFVYVRRSHINVDAESCGPYERSSADSSCKTECSVPENPGLCSTMQGFPAVGSRIKLTCNPPLTLVGNQSLLCQGTGEFDVSVPVCRVPDDKNIALQKPATQSSTADIGEALCAVDGNTEGNFFHGFCTHTDTDLRERPWWVVDLDHTFLIRYVEIHNRVDCCSDRLQKVHIYASTTDNLNNDQLSGSLCAHKPGPFSDPVILFQCHGGVVGRYLKIILDRYDEPPLVALTLCEVKVVGDAMYSQ